MARASPESCSLSAMAAQSRNLTRTSSRDTPRRAPVVARSARSVLPEQQRPDNVDPVAGYHAAREVRTVLEGNSLRSQYDIGHREDLGMNGCRAVDSADDRNLDLEEVGKQPPCPPSRSLSQSLGIRRVARLGSKLAQ